MSKKTLTLILLLIFTIFSAGCSTLFSNDSKPKTIQEDSNIMLDQQDNSSLNKIKGFENITQGLITDLSSNGNSIVLLNQGSIDTQAALEDGINNLILYNINKEEIQNIRSFQVNISLSQFDEKEKGLYYLDNKTESDFQLYWINILGNKKIKISPSDHQVTPNFYVLQDGDVYYGTQDGKIIHADKDSILSTIDVGTDYTIQQIYYYEDKDLIVFSAYQDNALNLYSMNPQENNPTLVIPKIIDTFAISKKEDKLIYITPIADSNKRNLNYTDLSTLETTKLVEGFPKKATISPKGNKVVYLDRIDSNSDLQNMWIYDFEKKEKKQIASNLKIGSELFWHPRKNKLFFSTFVSQDNQIQSTLHSLDFTN